MASQSGVSGPTQITGHCASSNSSWLDADCAAINADRGETMTVTHPGEAAHTKGLPIAATLGALGIVYGDIGTSPLGVPHVEVSHDQRQRSHAATRLRSASRCSALARKSRLATKSSRR